MRDNLLFYNIAEKTEENATELVHSLLESQFSIEDAKEIKIDRAHRMGRKKQGSKPQAIVAKFNYFPDKQRILSNAKKLKGTGIAVSKQFPEEIVATRKRLYPEMKKARDAGRKNKLARDKLHINGQLFREPSSTMPDK
jgi:3-methyladenine DNA glycosylase/8-oxoguanine DNA glycosylase